MEDILKALVSSRQQGSSNQGADPMADLVGSLLGGGGGSQGGVNLSDGVDAGDVMSMLGGLMGGAQQAQVPSQSQAGGLGGIMGALEGIMGGGQGGSQPANDPIMMMLQPFVAPLAEKANIPPAIAMIVVSFVAHKLLAHHPASGRDSNSFNLEDMLGQIGSGSIDSGLLHSSGMVGELSKKTGLDNTTAEKSLQLGFSMVGKSAASLMESNASVNKPVSTMKTGTDKTLKSTGVKRG
jgi:hypothetical protein